MLQIDLGKLGFNDRGIYDAAAVYSPRDIVSFGDSSFRCMVQTVAGESPASAPAKWVSLAKGTSDKLTTKGDILVHTGAGADRLPIGALGTALCVGPNQAHVYRAIGGRQSTQIAKLASNSQDGMYCYPALPMITSDGLVKVWGLGTALGNGDGSGTNQWTPSNLAFEQTTPPTLPIVQVAMCGQTGYALDSAGRVYAWGNNAVGQLGQGDTVNRAVATCIGWFVTNNIVIREIVVPKETQTVGNVTAWFITTAGHVYAVGMGTSGQLGNGASVNSSLPVRCGTLAGVKAVVAAGGGDYGCAYCIDGANDLYVWGNNAYGQLGLGDLVSRNTPVKTSLANVKKVCASSGNNSGATIGGWAVAMKNDNTLWGTGLNASGQLGQGNAANLTAWTIIATTGWTPADFTINGGYTGSLYVVTTAGNLYVCGDNAQGQLGLGDTTARNGLVQADGSRPFVGKVTRVKAFGSQSYNFAVLQDTDGRLYSCGYNVKSQCGVNTIVNQTTWANVFAPANTKDLGIIDYQLSGYTNFGRLYVLLADGRVLACGENATGDLGTQSGNLHLDYTLCDILF